MPGQMTPQEIQMWNELYRSSERVDSSDRDRLFDQSEQALRQTLFRGDEQKLFDRLPEAERPQMMARNIGRIQLNGKPVAQPIPVAPQTQAQLQQQRAYSEAMRNQMIQTAVQIANQVRNNQLSSISVAGSFQFQNELEGLQVSSANKRWSLSGLNSLGNSSQMDKVIRDLAEAKKQTMKAQQLRPMGPSIEDRKEYTQMLEQAKKDCKAYRDSHKKPWTDFGKQRLAQIERLEKQLDRTIEVQKQTIKREEIRANHADWRRNMQAGNTQIEDHICKHGLKNLYMGGKKLEEIYGGPMQGRRAAQFLYDLHNRGMDITDKNIDAQFFYAPDGDVTKVQHLSAVPNNRKQSTQRQKQDYEQSFGGAIKAEAHYKKAMEEAVDSVENLREEKKTKDRLKELNDAKTKTFRELKSTQAELRRENIYLAALEEREKKLKLDFPGSDELENGAAHLMARDESEKKRLAAHQEAESLKKEFADCTKRRKKLEEEISNSRDIIKQLNQDIKTVKTEEIERKTRLAQSLKTEGLTGVEKQEADRLFANRKLQAETMKNWQLGNLSQKMAQMQREADETLMKTSAMAAGLEDRTKALEERVDTRIAENKREAERFVKQSMIAQEMQTDKDFEKEDERKKTDQLRDEMKEASKKEIQANKEVLDKMPEELSAKEQKYARIDVKNPPSYQGNQPPEMEGDQASRMTGAGLDRYVKKLRDYVEKENDNIKKYAGSLDKVKDDLQKIKEKESEEIRKYGKAVKKIEEVQEKMKRGTLAAIDKNIKSLDEQLQKKIKEQQEIEKQKKNGKFDHPDYEKQVKEQIDRYQKEKAGYEKDKEEFKKERELQKSELISESDQKRVDGLMEKVDEKFDTALDSIDKEKKSLYETHDPLVSSYGKLNDVKMSLQEENEKLKGDYEEADHDFGKCQDDFCTNMTGQYQVHKEAANGKLSSARMYSLSSQVDRDLTLCRNIEGGIVDDMQELVQEIARNGRIIKGIENLDMGGLPGRGHFSKMDLTTPEDQKEVDLLDRRRDQAFKKAMDQASAARRGVDPRTVEEPALEEASVRRNDPQRRNSMQQNMRQNLQENLQKADPVKAPEQQRRRSMSR